MSTGKSAARKAFKLSEAFVIANKGQWDHKSWELLVKQADDAGFSAEDDEVKRNFGNMIESGKFFYRHGEKRS